MVVHTESDTVSGGARQGRSSIGSLYSLRITVKAVFLAIAVYLYRPARDLWRTLLRRHPVRVFTFHRVTDLCSDPISVSPQRFERQLRYLARHHDVTTLEKAVASLERGERRRTPLAVVTFDDGYESVFTTAFPIMQELGVPGCVFVTTDFVGTRRRFPHDDESPDAGQLRTIDWQQLEKLRSAGWSIGSHTASHPRLAECDAECLRHQLEAPMAALRRRFSPEQVFLAYPFGGRTDISEAGLVEAMKVGYRACFSNFGGENNGVVDRARLHRIDIGANIPPLAWKARIHGIVPLGVQRLFDRLRA